MTNYYSSPSQGFLLKESFYFGIIPGILSVLICIIIGYTVPAPSGYPESSISEDATTFVMMVLIPFIGVLLARKNGIILVITILLGLFFFIFGGYLNMDQYGPIWGFSTIACGIPVIITMVGMRPYFKKSMSDSLESVITFFGFGLGLGLGIIKNPKFIMLVVAFLTLGGIGMYSPGLVVLTMWVGVLLVGSGFFDGGCTTLPGILMTIIGILAMGSTIALCMILGQPIPAFDILDAVSVF